MKVCPRPYDKPVLSKGNPAAYQKNKNTMTKKGTDIKMVSIREPAAAIHYIYRFREKNSSEH